MGKKKHHKKKPQVASNSRAPVNTGEKTSNGVGKKKPRFAKQGSVGASKKRQNTFRKQNTKGPKKQLPETVNRNNSKDAPKVAKTTSPVASASMKRKTPAQDRSKEPKPKRKKESLQSLASPGQFVRLRNPATSPEEVQKKKPSLAVCKFEAHYSTGEEDFEESEDYFEDADSSSIDEELSSGEELDENSSNDDEYSIEEEEAEEEFDTDTDYSEEYSSDYDSSPINYTSEDDEDYDPGEQYDDVIVSQGEAKYRDLSSSRIKFNDDSMSEIVEYVSDTEEQVKKKRDSSEMLVKKDRDTSKATVSVGRVRLDRPQNAPKDSLKIPKSSVKGAKIVCSRHCSHDQISPGKVTQIETEESPLSLLKHNDDEVQREPEPGPEHESSDETPELETTETCEDDDDDPGTVKFYNAIDSYHVLLHLTESIHFHGNLSVTLISGSASMLDYKLNSNETVTAHAPVGYSTVSITPNPSKVVDNWKDSSDIKDMFFEEDLKEIERNLKSSHALLLLHKTSNERVKMVKKYSSNRVFPNMITYKKPRPFSSTEYILQCRFSFHSQRIFQVNPDWEWISVTDKSRIVITGGKNVGKTTLSRHLLNKNVKTFGRILLIDLDIGQPEISLPQTVSYTLLDRPILGMGCFVDKQPDKSYLFGDLNVANAPQRYFECVSKLIQDVRAEEEFKNIPWIVNTMGYVKGVGLELMIALLRLIAPTDVVQIAHNIQLENFDCEITTNLVNEWNWAILSDEVESLSPCEEFKTFCYNTMVSGNLAGDLKKSKAPETRQMNILAHLGGILGDNCDWITQSRPVCAPLDKIKIFNFTDEEINEELNCDFLNANLVYLCKQSDDNDILQCLGIGIVRGIDETLQTVYLLPSTRQNLIKVNTLAICHITLPPLLILNQSSVVQDDVPFIYNTDEGIGSRNVVSRAFRPEKAIVNMYAKNVV
ncbi:polynucleotide 5'-hydroxyl-kinase NOL9 isoform X2 [Phlebotomus argentipes]|uniref:polynucleotide 5'-hydroxyl-kinase NOL9 isoform X2 n=1 Tax=Phlebotomus argentipes TaxID=94469 RepID=UPI00289328AC|nr:polynucleotide 5'-hydroxyl-kinase NOL9 isoform X2 [Phlebotomus argentipes]